jgi:hypothetical protein
MLLKSRKKNNGSEQTSQETSKNNPDAYHQQEGKQRNGKLSLYCLEYLY